MLELYGTTTSPFVRRVLVVADELGIPTTLHDINDPAVLTTFRALTPVWKVPVAVWGGRTILDSHAITEILMAERGPGPLAPFDPLDLEARNAITIADGAADALINALYLARDGLLGEQSAYLRKQHDRAAASLAWLDAWAAGSKGVGALGLVEIALVTALEWMRFRQTYPIEQHPNLVAFLAQHEGRSSFVRTRPHA